MTSDLSQLRHRLTFWYVGVFALVLVAFGLATLFVTTREISLELDRSLNNAVNAIIGAARIREREGPPGRTHVDALDELHIPDRSLYLFDGAGHPVHPDTAAPWLRELALAAARRGAARAEHHSEDPEASWRASARRFPLHDNGVHVAVAAADVVELEASYPNVIIGFGLAALVALLLAGAGGWLLAQRSIRPVEEAFAGMRQFMADAAHELRTPVSVVKGHAEVALRRPREPSDYVAALSAIHSEAGRLAGVLENVLMIARADAEPGAWPVVLESVFLDDIALDAADAARVLGALKDVTVTVEHLDEVAIRGDRGLLRQLMMILLDNAVKFTPSRGRVEISVVRGGSAGILSVCDNGPGIPAELVPKLFERFTRGEDARERTGGAGLGLSIAKWIAQMHDARITVHDMKGGGTEMRVTFPLDAAA
jgi:signal transduction histidine kinase